MSRRVAAITDAVQVTATRQAAPTSGPVPGQFAARGLAAWAVEWLMAALAGETPAARAKMMGKSAEYSLGYLLACFAAVSKRYSVPNRR